MKKRLTHNLGLKFLALLFSIALWFIIVNISDPVNSEYFTEVPVTILNAGSVTDEGKVFTILDGTDTVNIRVYAPRSVLESFSEKDISVIADMEDMTFMNTVTYKINFSRYAEYVERYILSSDNMKVAIEDVKGIQLAVVPITIGVPADGYVLGDVSLSQNMVRLTGGESIIKQIARAEAIVDIEGWSSDINTKVPLKLYDKYDNEVNPALLTSAVSDINVNIAIYPTKDVKVNAVVSGTPADGFKATGQVTVYPDAIKIAGPAAVLETIDAIEIPEGNLNVTGQSSDMRVEVNIADFLPNGVFVITEDGSKDCAIRLTADIEEIITRTYLVLQNNITIENVPEGYEAVIDSDSLEGGGLAVSLSGSQTDLNQLDNAENWKTVIDFSEYADTILSAQLEEAVMQVPVTVVLPEHIVLANEPVASLRINKIQDEEE